VQTLQLDHSWKNLFLYHSDRRAIKNVDSNQRHVYYVRCSSKHLGYNFLLLKLCASNSAVCVECEANRCVHHVQKVLEHHVNRLPVASHLLYLLSLYHHYFILAILLCLIHLQKPLQKEEEDFRQFQPSFLVCCGSVALLAPSDSNYYRLEKESATTLVVRVELIKLLKFVCGATATFRQKFHHYHGDWHNNRVRQDFQDLFRSKKPS
jgi:hypothetical protein